MEDISIKKYVVIYLLISYFIVGIVGGLILVIVGYLLDIIKVCL